MRITRRIATASLLAMALAAPAFAEDKPTILVSVPGLTFPFFVHMMEAFKAEAAKQGFDAIESDGQVSSPKQTADIEAALAKGVKGIVISPNEVDAMAPALQEAVDAKVPVVTVDRRVPSVTGILGHVGADNVKGGEAQGELVEQTVPERRHDHQPSGPVRRKPRDRPQQGPPQRARQGRRQVQDRLRADRRLRPRKRPLGHRSGACRDGDASASHRRANDDMALGALEAVKGRNLKGIVIIGFDALPEALGKIRDGEITATIEQFPGKQSATGVDMVADFLKTGKKPAQQITLLTPQAITKDNLNLAERLNEVK